MRPGLMLLPVLGGLALAAPGLASNRVRAWRWHLPRTISPPAVPADNPLSAAKVALGRRLFYDADLSADGTMSCATCHEQHRAFSDGNTAHPGVTGAPGRRNVPGLANVAWFSPLTLADPAQTALEQQVALPIGGIHPVEMGMRGREAEIGARLSRDDCYRQMFRAAYPQTAGRIDPGSLAAGLASFERTLVSYGSAFDRGRMSPPAWAGFAIFSRDCASCHAGPRFTDLAYHRLGPTDAAATDQGLAEKTGNDSDRGRFRTPSLRNVALTGPWWHDGSAPTLAVAILRHGKPYKPGNLAALQAFLGTLSDSEFLTRQSLTLPKKACGRSL